MSGTDFDISNYSTEELVNIIGLGGVLPLTNGKIVEKIQEMKDQFEEKFDGNGASGVFDAYGGIRDDDTFIIKVNELLASLPPNVIENYEKIFGVSFNPGYVVDVNNLDQQTKKNIVTDWGNWSTSIYSKEFRMELNKLMIEDIAFAEHIEGKINEPIDGELYEKAFTHAEDARDGYIFFFDQIAHRLREYKKEEYSTDYYEEEEENEKSLLEGDFMDDNEKIMAANNFAMPIWDRTTFKGAPPAMPKDYINPLSRGTMTKTINIDSQYRTIADPVVCIRCPDTLQYYETVGTGVTGKFSVVASNNDGKILIAGNSGQSLYKLDINEPDDILDDSLISTWDDISFNKSVLENEINKEWKDITMNYSGNYIAVCNKKHIWYSISDGSDNTWEKGKVNYLTDVDLSNSDISGNWKAITSDFTGKNLFACRDISDGDIYADFKKGGVCYSDDYAATWVDLSGEIKHPNLSLKEDMSQNWIDIEVSGDGKKVYGIYKENDNYYIVKSINNGLSWDIINVSKLDNNTELIDYDWKQIVTNLYGTKVFIIAGDYGGIWRSFDSGTNWSKVTGLDSSWNSITCSLDGLKVAVWDTTNEILRFSENGGADWNGPATVTKNDTLFVIAKSNIVISDDGDRILGLDYSGNIFTSKKCVEKDLLLFDRPSNFTINLSEPIKNVVSIAIKNIELPHSWDVFSESEGTNVFYVKKANEDIIKIIIPEGSYHYNDNFGPELNLIKTLNLASIDGLDDWSLPPVNFSHCEIIDDTELILTGYQARPLIVGETMDISGFSGSDSDLNQKYTVAAVNSRNEYVLTGKNLPQDKISIGELAITKIEVFSNVATVTLSNVHSLNGGDLVLIRNTHFNGKREVNSVVGKTFKFSISVPDVEYIYISDAFAKRLLFDPKVRVKKHELIFSYRGSNNIVVRNYSEKSMTIFWHREESNDVCGPAGQGTKVNYNLGWLLGFRKTLLGLGSRSAKVGTAKLNLKGSKYVFVTLDEYSNNKAPDTCISYENNAATFNMPSYFVKTTMGIEVANGKITEDNKCWVKPDSPPSRYCGKKRANPELLSNLTAAQRYTIENIRNALLVPKKKQYKSPIISNYLAKVQLLFNSTISPSIQYTTERRVEATQETRDYFGPITLRKFKIRLLNERGNEIDMNEDNWSFTLLIKQLYNN